MKQELVKEYFLLIQVDGAKEGVNMMKYVAMTLLQLAGWLALLAGLLGGALIIDAEITLDAVAGVSLFLLGAGIWMGVVYAVKTFSVPSWYQAVSLFVVSFVVVLLLTVFY